MDAQHQVLANRALAHYNSLPPSPDGSSHRRLLIAVGGQPGSGKTTSTFAIANILNSLVVQDPPFAVVVATDGFHYSRAHLDGMPNAVEAHLRRGAPWTFDAEGIVKLVRRCRAWEEEGDEILAPTFDHKIKDPVEGGLVIRRETRILLFDGLYLLVDEQPWAAIGKLVDEKWFVSVEPPERVRMRLARRHVESGIEKNMEDALKRTDGNDMLNGEYIVKHSKAAADVIIESIDEQLV